MNLFKFNKTVFNGLFVLFIGIIFTASSCGVVDTSVNVKDGMYLVGGDYKSPDETNNAMSSASIIPPDFSYYRTKQNYYNRIMFLKTGQEYKFVQVASKNIARTIGGTTASADSSFSGAFDITGNAVGSTSKIFSVREARATASSPQSLTVTKDGYYLVYLDDSTTTANNPTNSYYAIPIIDVQIGSPTPTLNTKLTPPVSQTSSADAVWTSSANVSFAKGDFFSFRINSAGKINSIDKKIDKSNVYTIPTFYGTTADNVSFTKQNTATVSTQLGALQIGGSFQIADDASVGSYSVKFTISTKGAVTITMTK